MLSKLFYFVKYLGKFKLEILLMLLMIPAIFDIFRPGYYPMHDDLQVFRVYEMHKCTLDGQFPCRWVPDGGYGYGYPLMQFYPPMPYYPMELMVILGLGYFFPIKVMFALSFVLSGIGMYLLAKEFFGKWGGLLSAVLYVYSPYHAVDIYVRGAMNEGWGMAWFPFVLLYLYKIITGEGSVKRKGVYLLGIFLALQLTSHNVMTMVFAPTAVIWALYWIFRTKKLDRLKDLIYSGLLGIGLSAFFFIPVVLEQKYVHVDSMMVGYFNYLAHFADLNQLFFSRFWAYGGSTWGPNDGMSFAIGHVQWIGSLIASLYALFSFKKNRNLSLAVWMLTLFGFGYAFLTHFKSDFVWSRVSLLQFAQFPWRLVALAVFYLSFAAGFIARIPFSKFTKTLVLSSLLLFTILWNVEFFHFEYHLRYLPLEKYSGKQWELQVTGGIFDYLPKTAPKPPGDPAFTIPRYIKGTGAVENFNSGTNWMSFDTRVSSKSAEVMLPLFTFPGLSVKVNGQKVNTGIDPALGRVIVSVDQGHSHITAKIGYTAVRLISDLLTLLSLVVLYYLIKNDRKHT